MRFSTAVLIATSLVSHAYEFCATDAGSKEQIANIQSSMEAFAKNNSEIAKGPKSDAKFTVTAQWNIFYDQNNPADGNVSDSTITQTLSVVNSYFNQAGLYFTTSSQNIRRIAVPNSTVHGVAIGNALERQIKQYRQGNAQTLNIYIVGENNNEPAAAWATLPSSYQYDPQYDGVVHKSPFLAGGSFKGYNSGKVLVHEIGHWLGLYHTFQDGCNGSGDYVDDTPAEASAASGCPTGRNTCSASGNDPIDNLMDYSSEVCKVRFTSGQYNRIASSIYQFRGINLFN